MNLTYKTVNPVSDDGTSVYVRAIDGKMKGHHIWIDRNASTHRWRSAKLPKITDRAVSLRMGSCTYKEHVYRLKEFRWNTYDTVYTIFYLSSLNGSSLDDAVAVFGPKTA